MFRQNKFIYIVIIPFIVCGIIFGYANFSRASIDATSVGINVVSRKLDKPIINVQIVNDYFMAVSGTTIPSGNVHIIIKGNNGYSKTTIVSADAGGSWSYETEALSKGKYTASCYVDDGFGHRSDVSDEKSGEIKLKSPDFSVSVIAEGEIRIKSDGGTGFPAGTVHLKITSNNGYSYSSSINVNGNGEWNTTIGSLPDGNYTIEVFAKDADGGESVKVSHTFKITLVDKGKKELPPIDPGTGTGEAPSVIPGTGETPPVAPEGGLVEKGTPILSQTVTDVTEGVKELVRGILELETVKKTKETVAAGIKVAAKATEAVNKTFEAAAKVVDTPVGQTVTTVATASGVASIWSIVSNAISTTAGNSFVYFGNSFLLFLQSWRNRRRGVKNWGMVFESETNMPIDFATVRIYSEDGKILDSVLTDKEGRFGFLVTEGSYSVDVQKDNFNFPSKLRESMFDHDLYQNVYTGGLVHFEAGQVINFNIPIDVEGKSLRESSQEKIKAMSLPWKKWLKVFQKIFFVIGFALATFKAFYLVSFVSVLFVLIYVALISHQIFGRQRSYGNLVDKTTGEPIPFAIVSIFSEQDPAKKVGFVISDMMGRVYRLIGNGKYNLNIKGKTLSGHDFHVKKEASVDGGVLNEKVEINPIK